MLGLDGLGDRSMQPDVPSKIADTSTGLRAAQYVRVSTDQQKYSIENQAAALAAYAARRMINIVRTYSDMGRSGVRIVGRDALQQLISDVQRQRADFDCVLVYDVSRWGRFQDVDESAYYEFICKRAGINIHYCADEFENDASFVVNGAKQASDVALATAAAEIRWRNGLSLAGTFEGEFSNVTRSYAAKGVAKFEW
jgi:predicted site-specific integrase-resolvase